MNSYNFKSLNMSQKWGIDAMKLTYGLYWGTSMLSFGDAYDPGTAPWPN